MKSLIVIDSNTSLLASKVVVPPIFVNTTESVAPALPVTFNAPVIIPVPAVTVRGTFALFAIVSVDAFATPKVTVAAFVYPSLRVTVPATLPTPRSNVVAEILLERVSVSPAAVKPIFSTLLNPPNTVELRPSFVKAPENLSVSVPAPPS